MQPQTLPLAGVRVLELGQLIAGPLAGTLLGYFGAEIIKVEPPGGDPLRTWRGMDGDTSVWWSSMGRNKQSVVIDLRMPRGQQLVRQLMQHSDVVLENFRPGTLEAWGLDPNTLARELPRVVFARVSGFGQTGPYRERAGFASVCEAMAGLRHLTGEPGRVPVRSNLSLGDSLGGLHAVIGILLALFERERSGRGQVVDVALTESIFNVLESVLPEYDRLGIVRGPSGPTISGIVPSNTYPTSDGQHVVIGANTSKLFDKLMRLVGRTDLAERADLAQNPGRVAAAAEIDAAISAFTQLHAASLLVKKLADLGIPGGPINDVAQIVADPHFQARGLFDSVSDSTGEKQLPQLAPRLSRTPGTSCTAGPALGAHTDQVLASLLALDATEISGLRNAGVVA